jgi:hypothetical protein
LKGILWTGHFRVYYNKRDEYPFIWSVDRGTADTERKFQHIVVEVPLHGAANINADNRNEPKAWLHGEGTIIQSGDMCLVKAPE